MVTKQPWQLWAYFLSALLPVAEESWSPWLSWPHATLTNHVGRVGML